MRGMSTMDEHDEGEHTTALSIGAVHQGPQDSSSICSTYSHACHVE